MSLANLFDSPSPPRPARPQGRNPLFLQSPTPSVVSPPSRAKRTISSTKANTQKDLALRLFDDDDDDEIERFPRTAMVAESASLRAGDTSDDGLRVGEEEEKSTNKRRAPLKVDILRLQEPIGLRRLAELSKNRAKIKGKGHERSDLNNLMNDYRIWTHQLFPKTDFSGTVRDIENLCHTRMSRRILDDLQASLLDGPAPSGGPSSGLELNRNDIEAGDSPSVRIPSLHPSLSRSRTTTQFSDNAEEEDDIDAMIAAAQAETRQMGSVSQSIQKPPPTSTLGLLKGKQPLFSGPDDDDAEEDWSILDEIEQSNTKSTAATNMKKPKQHTSDRIGHNEQGGDEEEADWAMFDEAHGS